MKQSRNNIIIRKDSNEYIVANTRTRSVIELNDSAFREFSNGDINKLQELSKENFQQLIEMGFLIPENLNEDNLLDYLLQKERLNNNTLLTYLMYSTACNFACQYCYERGEHIKIESMSEETIKQLIGWYKYKIEHGRYKECRIVLFGGEPLLFPEFFRDFLKEIGIVAKTKGVELITEITTNGYLLSEEIIETFLPFNLKNIHITLDGAPETHNALRPLKGENDSNTFDVILKNILNISNLYPNIELVCRISFNKSNVNSIPELLDILHEKDPQHKIYSYFAHTTQTYSQISQETSFCSQNVYSDDIELADCYIYLWKEAKKRGFEIPSFITLGPCMFFSANGFVITPQGDLYKCLDMVGVKDRSIGNVSFPIYYTTDYYKLVMTEKIKSCLQTDCPFIPICGSGCVIEPWLKYNDYNKICCKRNMLEKIHNTLLIEKFK